MFDNLLAEFSKSQMLFDIPKHKKAIMVNILCKHCSSTVKDKTILKDHMNDEHSVSCTVCHMKFNSNKRFKKTKT